MASYPFTLTVFDKDFSRLGWVNSPQSLKVNVRHNAVSTATFSIDADHPRAEDLLTSGVRVHIDYDGKRIVGGPVRSWAGKGPARSAVLTFTVEDDWRLLTRVLGWPVPTAPLTAQTSEYDTRTGPAETVAKAVIAANVARLGLPVTVAPSLGRGSSITAAFRFHPLADRLLPLITQAGIGLTVRQEGAGFVVDAYAPAAYPRTLSEASGVVQAWEWTHEAPRATRTVVGAGGEGVDRYLSEYVSVATEVEWGDVVEVFTDARNVKTDDPDLARLVVESAAQTLVEGATRAGLKVTLSETETFRYGRTVSVGDTVRMEVGPGITVEDVLLDATLTWDVASGVNVSPVIGDRADVSTLYARAVSTLARGLRNLNAGR